MSTVSLDATDLAAAMVREKGAEFVDAPVSGSVKPAERGQLVILAGAEPAVLDRVAPLLKVLGHEVVRCGPVGQGTRMKLVLNLFLGNMMQTLAEGLVAARSLGLAPDTLLQALAHGPLAAPLFQMKGKAIVDGDFSSQFPVRLMFKDLNLVLGTAGKLNVPLPQTAVTRETFSAAMAKGHGDRDVAAVVKVLEAAAGRRVKD